MTGMRVSQSRGDQLSLSPGSLSGGGRRRWGASIWGFTFLCLAKIDMKIVALKFLWDVCFDVFSFYCCLSGETEIICVENFEDRVKVVKRSSVLRLAA